MEFDFRPDWTGIYKVKDFAENFREEDFRGPGWYFSNGDCCLILATDDPEQFQFIVWGARDPRQAVTACLSLPEYHLPPSV